jgi:hypothetical protein
MTSLTNNDFVKGYYGIYTSNSGYTGDIGNDTHPADNQWVGMNSGREQESSIATNSPDLMYCRNISTYWLSVELGDPYITTLSSMTPNIYGCPQQIIIDPTNKAQKTVTQDVLQLQSESKSWVNKGMNKIVKNNLVLFSDSILSSFIDTIAYKATGLLDSVLILREEEMINEATLINQSVIPETVMDELEKEMNTYYLTVETSGINSLSAFEIDRIREIAGFCPFTEGIAVYQARILAAYFDPFDTEYHNVCEEEDNGKSMEEIQVNDDVSVLAVPNPCNNSIKLVSDNINGRGILYIYDISGRCVWSGETELNNTDIDISVLSNGAYHYSLVINGNVFNGNFTKINE